MDLKQQKALADRLLAKVVQPATVTIRADVLGETDQTISVKAKLLNVVRKTTDPTVINAVVTRTSVSIRGGELLIGGISYDIIEVEEKGVGQEQLLQRVVLHER